MANHSFGLSKPPGRCTWMLTNSTIYQPIWKWHGLICYNYSSRCQFILEYGHKSPCFSFMHKHTVEWRLCGAQAHLETGLDFLSFPLVAFHVAGRGGYFDNLVLLTWFMAQRNIQPQLEAKANPFIFCCLSRSYLTSSWLMTVSAKPMLRLTSNVIIYCVICCS